MRSQGTKPLPKKGALTKTTFKPNSPTKPVKKKVVTTKKVKKLVKKSLVKTPKRTAVKDDSSDTKTEDDSSTGEKSDSDSAKSGTSNAPSLPRSESLAKRTKKELKEKKKPPATESVKLSTKKIVNKKGKLTSKGIKKKEDDSDKIRYKLNSEIRKKAPPKMTKLKTIPKKEDKDKAIAQQKKKPKVLNKNNVSETDSKEDKNTDKRDSKSDQEVSKSISVDKKEQLPGTSESKSAKIDSEIDTKSDNLDQNLNTSTQSNSKTSSAETSKSESDRPPKFFTSARSPRTVDIDVRCCKTSKGNLSVYERFISSKIVDTKNNEVSKDKSSLNNPVSQDPEIDVYAFTDKADSPKSILSDFRNPMDKNTEQKVRPVARVKGTVIDKKNEIEKKKFSPHRPIEEVVKQLKAKKGSEVLKVCQTQTSPDVTSSVDSNIGSDEKDNVEDPKPIVSKSYKMVARKSSIPGKPFSPIKFLDQDENSQGRPGSQSKSPLTGKKSPKSKSKSPKSTLSDDELENSKFSLNTKSQSRHYSSSDESVNDSNDENDTKESSESESNTNKKTKKTKKYRRITDAGKKNTSRELKELSKDSIIDLKDDTILGNEKPSKRRLKLLSMWSGPKKHRMASLNAIAKVHCLYENESRTHMELGLMKTVDRLVMPTTSKPSNSKKKEPKPKDSSDEKQDTTSESEYERKEKKDESSEDDTPEPSTRTLRGEPGIRSAGKYWDPKSCTSSSEDSEHDSKFKVKEKKKITPKPSTSKPEPDKPPAKMKKTAGVPVKKRRIRNEVVMDLKDMVVQKRMASLNATAILAASYEKRSPKSSKDGTTSDSCSDESFSRRPKNGAGSGVKSEAKTDGDKADAKKDTEEVAGDRKQKVEVIVNQDTDVTITGVYSTHHEGFCTVSGLQYRISATSHTQTTATANCEKEGCGREEGARYTPLSALSSMQPPADHAHAHPVPELGGLARRAGCSSAFSAPSPSAHHEPGKPTPCTLCDPLATVWPHGYYQPAGPLIKEAGADAERALARYHPPHYHPPHPPVLPQYGPYYPSELCYGRYYRPPAPAYHVPAPQPDAPMVGVAGDPYPPPQYYGAPPCYQHPPPRVGYLEYRGCPCPMNACPKNVHIGPATGKAPASGGPADAPAPAPPGAPLRPRGRARAASPAVAHGSGKDPPLEPEPPAAADAPRPCPLPAIGGASPKRELYAGRARRAGGAGEGPPSPARGSAGACAPQPPPAPPRRARLGKAMARRSLAGDDTTVLSPPPPDDDVLAVSPPAAAPVDLSSSDETPLLDVKKENEPPAPSPPRADPAPPRPAKRRHSRPKLEIELGDLPLDDACRTNGIGEHVKLQKRRKVSSEQNDAANRTETITSKDLKKKSSPKPKRSPKTPPAEKKTLKRKGDSETENSVAKKLNVGKPEVEDVRLTNVAALPQEQSATKPKNKSALLLDNLIRKNSIDRADPIDVEINPAELFLSPRGNSPLNCTKKTLNINNNVVENSAPVNGVQPKTIAAVSQLIERKLAASKNALKTPVVDTNVTQSLKPVKSVLKPQNAEVVNQMLGTEESGKPNNDVSQCEPVIEKDNSEKTNDIIIPKDTSESANVPSAAVVDNVTTTPIKIAEKPKLPECNAAQSKDLSPVSNGPAQPTEPMHSEPAPKPQDPVKPPKPNDLNKPEKVTAKRSKLSIEKEPKKGDKAAHEKVVKLMVFKKSVIKADEAASVVEEACASPLTVRPSVVRRRRRRSGLKRHRRPPALLPPPLADREPRWSNGWHWDGECHVSKVYLNNDMRQDRTARCYSRMLHDNGDLISRGDCVLLRAAPAKAQPFVAKVARLWENPDDGEMMVSLVWYYRPEHTELGRTADDAPDEVFASRHRDANSVACIEDKCYVLTFNEYCRYRKRLKAAEEGIPIAPSIVPPMPAGEVFPAVDTTDSKLTPAVSPDLVLFCRKIYDFRSKKIQMPNK